MLILLSLALFPRAFMNFHSVFSYFIFCILLKLEMIDMIIEICRLNVSFLSKNAIKIASFMLLWN